jgi:hypothetical protein
MPPEQLLPPPHVAVHGPDPQVMPAPQLALPVQLAVHAPSPTQVSPELHVLVAVHDRSHTSAEHVTFDAHTFDAAHAIVHVPPLHETPLLHVPGPVHWMSHALALHVIGPALQLPLPLHSIRHGTPEGGHAQVAPQSITQNAPLHVPVGQVVALHGTRVGRPRVGVGRVRIGVDDRRVHAAVDTRAVGGPGRSAERARGRPGTEGGKDRQRDDERASHPATIRRRGRRVLCAEREDSKCHRAGVWPGGLWLAR